MRILVWMAALFLIAACERKEKEPPANRDEVELEGEWATTDESGNNYDIILYQDGTATTTWRVPRHGRWQVDKRRRAHIMWRDGTNEYIHIDGHGRGRRETFSHGRPFQGGPHRAAPIHRK